MEFLSSELAIIALTFGAIFLVELPDKTFIATLVMATKYRPLYVWIGVSAAFVVQTVVAVVLGKLAGFLPSDVVHGFAGLMFLIGSVMLFRQARRADTEELAEEQEFAAKATPAEGFRVILTCFLILFAAEWGDLSQLLTLSLVAKYDAPAAVFIGAVLALMTVSALAVIVGKQLLKWVKPHVLHYLGGTVCLILAGVVAADLLR